MKFRSVFDVIGPVMIGPSSSHTAGAVRIGRIARTVFARQPKWVKIYLYGSFAETFRGHGTDIAIVAGLLNYDTFDDRIKCAFEDAHESGLEYEFIIEKNIEQEHPNTARLVLGDEVSEMELTAISIGGGKMEVIELNGFTLRLSGNYPALLIVHNDLAGTIASVLNVVAKRDINVAHMEVGRKEKGKRALMVIELDHVIDEQLIDDLVVLPNIIKISTIAD